MKYELKINILKTENPIQANYRYTVMCRIYFSAKVTGLKPEGNYININFLTSCTY